MTPCCNNNPRLLFNLIAFLYSVGTNVGDIGLWEVGSRERLVQKTFKVWDLSKCSMLLQVPMHRNNSISTLVYVIESLVTDLFVSSGCSGERTCRFSQPCDMEP